MFYYHLLFRVRSRSNGMRCMSLYIIMGNTTIILRITYFACNHVHICYQQKALGIENYLSRCFEGPVTNPLKMRQSSLFIFECTIVALQLRNNERDGLSKHQPHDCLLNDLFRCRSKKTSKLRVTGLCEGNTPVTGEFPAQRASKAENVSILWRHHENKNKSDSTSLKQKCHFVKIFVIVCTGSYYVDNLWCRHWQKFRQNGISVSMYKYNLSPFIPTWPIPVIFIDVYWS